ncbi:MAG TPA: endonuclease domain-containing protein [Gemmatimonadales bacterium]|nr:endonuclease domain-containing protein [Gemmatimonadales bacterium]
MIRHRLDRKDYPDAVKLAIARQVRREPTASERFAWSLLRRRGMLGLKFRRQHVLHGFIVDFYCPRLRLVLELDGASHEDASRAGYDAARTAFLTAHGYSVLRLHNREVSRERLEQLLRPHIGGP